MAEVLIAYSTTEGQTRKIAQYIGERVRDQGHRAEVVDIRRPPAGLAPEGFVAVLVGGSVHAGKHSRRLSEFIIRHKARLEGMPSGFFSVSLSAGGTEQEKSDAERMLEEFLKQVDWSPGTKVTLAGALRYRDYGLLKRWIMKKISKAGGKETDTSRNHEYTDWQTVDRFVAEVLGRVE